MANRTKLTVKKREQFVKELTEHGGVSRAARSIGMARGYMYEVKGELPDFASAWDEAVAEYVEKLEAEADRRAHDGVTKTLFYQGVEIGEEQLYSDTLLMFRLKALRPEMYRERSQVDHSGKVEHAVKYIAGVSEDDI